MPISLSSKTALAQGVSGVQKTVVTRPLTGFVQAVNVTITQTRIDNLVFIRLSNIGANYSPTAQYSPAVTTIDPPYRPSELVMVSAFVQTTTVYALGNIIIYPDGGLRVNVTFTPNGWGANPPYSDCGWDSEISFSYTV